LLRGGRQRHDPRVPRDGIVAQDPARNAAESAPQREGLGRLGPRQLTAARRGESLRTARLKLEQMQIPVAHIAETRMPRGRHDPAPAPAPGENSVGEGVELPVSLGRRPSTT
jgi:hypothetical protein